MLVKMDFLGRDQRLGGRMKFIGFQDKSPIRTGNVDKIIADYINNPKKKDLPSNIDDSKEQDVVADEGDLPAGVTNPLGVVVGEPRAIVEKKKKEKETKSKENATILWLGGIAIAIFVFLGIRK